MSACHGERLAVVAALWICVGASAFAHKGGLHVSAVEKDPRTYEHVPPEAVGNRRKLLVSDQAGRSNILAELDRLGVSYRKKDNADVPRDPFQDH